MVRKSQNQHLAALKKLSGLHPDAVLPGYKQFPPAYSDRILQEIGFLQAIFYSLLGKEYVTVSGKRLKHLYGSVRFDFAPGIVKSLLAFLRRETVIAFSAENTERKPFSFLLDSVCINPNKPIKANIGNNAIFVFFASHSVGEIVVHIPINEEGNSAVIRHQVGLLKAKKFVSNTKNFELVPEYISLCETTEFTAFVQRKIRGNSPEIDSLSDSEFTNILKLSLQPLLDFIAQGKKIPYGPDSEFLENKIYTLENELPESIARKVRQPINLLKAWTNRPSLPSTLVHGDYWIGNLIFDGDRYTKLNGIVDWEWCREEGLPALDAIQLITMSHAVRSRQPFANVLSGVWDLDNAESCVQYFIKILSHSTDISIRDLQYTAIVLWLETIWRGYIETTPDSDDWLEKLTTAPSVAINSWASKNQISH